MACSLRSLCQIPNTLNDHLYATTADNASNNQTMRTSLKGMLNAQGISWDAESTRINCLPHILNLAAKVFLEGLSLVYDNDAYNTEDDDEKDIDVPNNMTGVGATVVKVSTVVNNICSLLTWSRVY